MTGGEGRRFNEEGGEGDTEAAWQAGVTHRGCRNSALLLFAKPCPQGGGCWQPQGPPGDREGSLP